MTPDRRVQALPVVNLTQRLVLGFLVVAWLGLLAILVAAPDVYDAELMPLGLAGQVTPRFAFAVAITVVLR
jgi:hypothetical protein